MPPAVTYSPLKLVKEALEENTPSRRYFNAYGIITQYRNCRGRRRLVIRDEETTDLPVLLSWKAGVVWNPERRAFNRDDFEIGDVIRIQRLCVDSGQCSSQDVKQLMIFKSFSKSGSLDHRTQGVAYVQLEEFDRQRSEQLIQFLTKQITSCRFSDIPAESAIRTISGRVTSTAVTKEGHQILCLSDGSSPVIQSHCVAAQKCLLQSGGKRRAVQETSSSSIQLQVTDPVSSDQSVCPEDVIVVFNAKFDHQEESGVTLITANRNKKDGKAVRIVREDSHLAKAIIHMSDQNPKSSAEIPDPLQPSPSTSSSSPPSQSKKRMCDQMQSETRSQIDSSTERLFPSFIDTPIPLSITSLSQVISLSYQRPSYATEASAVDCSYQHGSICDLVHVRCRRCQFTESLEDRLQENAGIFLRKATKFKVLDQIPCPKGCLETDGKQAVLDFVFNLFFVIRDKKEADVHMVVCLSTFSAIKVFGVTPKDTLMHQAKRDKVFKILEAIFPKHADQRHDNFLMWLIKPAPFGKTSTQFIVLTITTGCSASH